MSKPNLNISQFLSKIDVFATEGVYVKLDSDSINLLICKKYPVSKKSILEDFNVLYEVSNLLHTLGLESVLKLLDGESYLNQIYAHKSDRDPDLELKNGILFGNSHMIPSIQTGLSNADILRNRNMTTVGAYDCVKCKSNNVDTVQKRVAASDEPLVSFNTCKSCGFKWRV